MKPTHKIKTLLALLTAGAFGAVSANAAVVFSDNFESPVASTSYTLANTSGTANTTKWVRASSGFSSTRNGIVREDRVGETFVDPVGNQAYGFRYSSNTGLTSAFNQIGALEVGQTITLTFNVIRDNFNGNNYANYNASIVLFDGAGTRNSVENNLNGTFAVLARATGTAASNTTYGTVTLSYTVGAPVVDNNGAAAGVSTAYNTNLLGKDIAVRWGGQGFGAVIDNVSVDIIPEPSAALLGGVGMLMLLRRRR